MSQNTQSLKTILKKPGKVVLYIYDNIEYSYISELLNYNNFILIRSMDLENINLVLSYAPPLICRIDKLEKEMHLYKSKYENIKYISTAKHILMEKYNLKEDEAYKYIIEKSMATRTTKLIVAQEIIDDERRK